MRDAKKDAPDSLLTFAHDVGAPVELISDHAAMLIGPQCEYVKQARFLNIKQLSYEPYTQRHNKFEGETRLLKHRWKNQSDGYQQHSASSLGLCPCLQIGNFIYDCTRR